MASSASPSHSNRSRNLSLDLDSTDGVGVPTGPPPFFRHSDAIGDWCVLSGRSNTELAVQVAEQLGVSLVPVKAKNFADGEIGVHVLENVREKSVFVIQGMCPPVNDNLVELLLLSDALRRASAKRIYAVIPYFGYARQDRKTSSRVPISAALVARLIESSGVDRIICIDLHAGQIQGFFQCPVDNLYGSLTLRDFFTSIGTDELVQPCVLSPDAGGVERADKFRQYLALNNIEASFAVMNKRRRVANEVASMELVGSVDGCDVIIVDDIIDTAGTLCTAASLLKSEGARRVIAVASHGLFSDPACERIAQCDDLDHVVVLNTIPLKDESLHEKISVMSCAPLLSRAIVFAVEGESVSSIFDGRN